jgi:hypothetical protein
VGPQTTQRGQIFWFKQARTHIPTVFVVSTFINIGMWFGRYVIIIASLAREYDPTVHGAWAEGPHCCVPTRPRR